MDMKIKNLQSILRVQLQLIFLSICLLLLAAKSADVCAQEVEFKRNSVKTGVGIGYNSGESEIGMGLVYSLGWQRCYGLKNKLRINPNMTLGGFSPFIISDVQDQFYRITSVGFNIHFDLIRYKALSIVTTAGTFVNYSRGLLGTGGRISNRSSEYFYNFYYGGNVSVGLRIDPKSSKLAYELRPINIYVGNHDFILMYLMFGIDFKFVK